MRIAVAIVLLVFALMIMAMFGAGSHGNIWSGMTEDWFFWAILVLCVFFSALLLTRKMLIADAAALTLLGYISYKIDQWAEFGICFAIAIGTYFVLSWRRK